MQTDKKIEYKGYLIEKYTWGRKQYQYFLSKDGVQIKEINCYLMKILNQVSIIKNNVDYQLKIINY
jgi:hypothetical protein